VSNQKRGNLGLDAVEDRLRTALSLAKMFPRYQSLLAEFRVDAFNIVGHSQLADANACYTSNRWDEVYLGAANQHARQAILELAEDWP